MDVAPWNRLSRLAPTGTTEPALQEAADRWQAVTSTRTAHARPDDIYNAAADLWEEFAMALETSSDTEVTREQVGDVSVTLAGSQGAIASALQRVGYFRMRGDAYTARLAEPLHGNEDLEADDDTFDGGLIWVG